MFLKPVSSYITDGEDIIVCNYRKINGRIIDVDILERFQMYWQMWDMKSNWGSLSERNARMFQLMKPPNILVDIVWAWIYRHFVSS